MSRRAFVSLGGRYVDTPNFKEQGQTQGQTPNQLISLFDFGGTLLLFETRGLVGEHQKFPGMDKKFPVKLADELYFEEGTVKGGLFYPKGKTQGEKVIDNNSENELVNGSVFREVGDGNLFRNFIECVRNRKREQLFAEIAEGHYSSALCHLGNISYRLAKERPFEKPKDFSA
jgi:hypothetical protein